MMKFSSATIVIALCTLSLIGISAWATFHTEQSAQQASPSDQDIVEALQFGDAVQLSALFTEDVNFFSPEGNSSGNWRQAAVDLKSFLHKHPTKAFTEDWYMPGNQTGVSYLKGTLVTQDNDYDLYATIYRNQIEQLDISHKKTDH